MAAITLPRQDADEITHRMQCRMRLRRSHLTALQRAASAFSLWARAGATPLQAARVAFATFRAFI